ncbi:MAG: 50S ribosomal protein L18 [Candidatus Omnitrophota bacterium]|jgi:large subunit ribosomal protein L18
MSDLKEKVRIARHTRIRKRIKSIPERPRLCVHRSLKNLYVQVIDDQKANTLFAFSTLHKEIKVKSSYGGNLNAAKNLGEVLAGKLKEKGINQIVFDKGGYLFHGRIKTFAEALKKGGIVF